MSNEYTQVILINVLAARKLRAADLNGRSDPYAQISLISQVGGSFGQPDAGFKWRTKTHKHTVDPQWSESVTLLARRTIDSIPIEVFDEDFGSGADSLGKVDIRINKTAPFTLQDAWYPLSGKGDSEIHVSYIFIPVDGVQGIAENADAMRKRLEEAVADDASDDAKISALQMQVTQLLTEKQQLDSYTNGLLAQISSLESHKASLEAQLTQAQQSSPKVTDAKLTITRAVYYAFDDHSKGTDKTLAVRAQATGNSLRMNVTNDLLQGDPFPARPKELHVFFTRSATGPEESVVVAEGGHIDITA